MTSPTRRGAHRGLRTAVAAIGALVAALITPLAAAPIAAAASPAPCITAPFNDVARGGDFCPDIDWMRLQQITSGYGDGTFRPGDMVTREAMTAFLYRVANPGKADPACIGNTPFPDVAMTDTFCGTITWLKSKNITGGYDDGNFYASRPVTRAALGTFLYRLVNPGKADPTCSSSPFSDVSAGSQFCGTISWLRSQGITSGYPDGTFRPEDAISREAMAAFLHRAADTMRTTVTLTAGTTTVGTTLRPGRYTLTPAVGEAGSLRIARGENRIVDEKLGTGGVPTVTIALNVGDRVTVTDLSRVTAAPATTRLRTSPATLSTGSYVVGLDIAPGSYTATPATGSTGTLTLYGRSFKASGDSYLLTKPITVTLSPGDQLTIALAARVTFTAT